MHAYYFFVVCYIRKDVQTISIPINKKSLTRRLLGCGAEWIRTTDSRIFSPMLYQLSYST